MAPFCKDEEKYGVVDDMVKKVQKIQKENIKIDNQKIVEVLTVNGVRFSLEDGSWGLINYNEMADANFPGFYIISSLNPFSYSVEIFHLFSLMIGFFTFIVFAFLLSLNDNSNSKTINFALASLILILPFLFREIIGAPRVDLLGLFLFYAYFISKQ